MEGESPDSGDRRRSGRRLVVIAVSLVLVDILRLDLLTPRHQVAFTDGFEVVVAVICVWACRFAAARSSASVKALWIMPTAFFALMAFADLHDFLQDMSLTSGILCSYLGFVGWLQHLPLALLIYFPLEEDQKLDWNALAVLDFLLVTVVVVLAYFRLIYVPHQMGSQPWTVIGRAELLRDVLISGGLLLRFLFEPSRRAQSFYVKVAGVLAAITVLRALLPGYANPTFAVARPALWLLLGILAVRFPEVEGKAQQAHGRRDAVRLLLNLFAAAALLVVVILVLAAPVPSRRPTYLIVGVAVMLFVGRSAVAERRRDAAEQALREGEEKFFRAFEHAPDAYYIATLHGGLIHEANERFEEVFGYTREEAIGKTSHELGLFVDPLERKKFVPEIEKNGYARNLEFECQRKDGKIIDVLFSGNLMDGYGEPMILGVVRDISEQKRAQEALVRLRAAVDTSGEVIFMTDPEGLFTFVNPEFTRLYGYTEVEVAGKVTPRILKSGAMDAEHSAQFWRTILSKTVVRGEITNKTKDGRIVYVASSVNAVLNQQGEISGYLAIQRDITERKRLEEQFTQAQKMEAVGRLAAGVAHDFNNLLTIINGYSDLILDQLPSAEATREPLAEIKNAGERAAGLTRQLLAFSRQQMRTISDLNLNTVIGNSLKMLRRMIGENIRLLYNPVPHLRLINADVGNIEQVLMNLAVNSRDAMPNGGEFSIEATNVDVNEADATQHYPMPQGQYVMLAVSDTGCGMDAETQKRIFDPFFTTKEVGKGTGLGLASVYGIVKQNGGFIWVYSELGKGTTFKIYLPAVAGAEAIVEARKPAAGEGSETVLLVEDEGKLRVLARRILESRGYKVLEAPGGMEALLVAKQFQGPIHMLLTDLVMPVMGGRELAQELSKQYPQMRILFMSGYTDDTVVRHGILEEGVAFLQKPFAPEALAQKVRQVIDAK